MGVPTPDIPLNGSCSTMFNNTLYSYTPDAFQSLPLTNDAKWSVLAMGESVTGGVCVKATPQNDTEAAALYIVGGTSNSSDYFGLQRYTFANNSWETIQPSVPVTQSRLYHGSVYLNKSDSILVYAGTQDGTQQLSSQTFTIQASPPYTVLAYQSIAPPAISPILMQWTESKAIFIGGSDTNTKAMIFSPSLSWVDSNATLAEPLYNMSAIKGVVIDGDDASKTVYTFDMTKSPNQVNRTILIDGNGNPVQNAAPIVEDRAVSRREESPSVRVKRGDLTLADWPAYNGTLAPSSTRTAYSICRDQSGLVVVSGGNDEDALCMFKARDNAWVNATAKLGAKSVAQQGLGTDPSSTSSTVIQTATASSTASATAAPAAAKNDASPAVPVKILAGVLGSILGIALILVAILAFFRWRRRRTSSSEAGQQRGASGMDEKNGMDFQDKGDPTTMTSIRDLPAHKKQSASVGSFSSMAILMGRIGHKRGESKASESSAKFNDNYKTTIGKPMEPVPVEIYQMAAPNTDEKSNPFAETGLAPDRGLAAPRGSTRGRGAGQGRGSARRSSGWDRYWSGGSAITSFIPGIGSQRTTYASEPDSEYSERPQSAMPPPLKITGDMMDGNRIQSGSVVSGSPTVAHHSNKFPLSPAMSGQIGRAGSVGSLVSLSSSYNDDRHDAFSSGVPASVCETDTWGPMDGRDWSVPRASNYTESVYDRQTLPRYTEMSFQTFQQQQGYGVERNTQRDTHFPGPGAPPMPSAAPPRPPPPSDMSWLNLGTDQKI